MSSDRPKRRSTPGSDLRRRRWIQRVLIAWMVMTLVTSMFYAVGKARIRRRSQPAATPARRS